MMMDNTLHGEQSDSTLAMASTTFSRVYITDIGQSAEAIELDQISICFDVSDNEEQVVISFNHDNTMVYVNDHQCHYLLLLLARQRIIDQAMGFCEQDLGWIELEQFTQMLGKKQQILYPQLTLFAKSTHQMLIDTPLYKQQIILPALVEIEEDRLRFTQDDIQINSSDWCD